MTFDVSRFRFAPAKDFLGVVMQQGRVQLDSDWNEWLAEFARRIQAGTLDTLGRAVVPRETPDGFRIQPTADALTIGRGRMYVDGLLAENHGPDPHTTWDPWLAELRGTGAVSYTQQPYYPNPPPLLAGGPHLVYLDVWQREVDHLHDPSLVEQAVGVGTTGRLQTVWQVKVLPNVGTAVTCTSPDEQVPGWAAATAPSAGRLTTGTAAVPTDADPCHVPPGGGYKGLENQLYRVEIHDGGAVGQATFKWSRDNGAVATAVRNISAGRDRLVVESVGRDRVLRFNDGDWVEVTDDVRELHGLPGEVRRIRPAGGVDDTIRTITLESPLTAGVFPTDAQGDTTPGRHTRIRRWDQRGKVLRSDGTVFDLDRVDAKGLIPVPPAGTTVLLEHGVEVSFGVATTGGSFRVADAWSFAARTADASIEVLQAAPPRTIHHHYARLALVTFPSDVFAGVEEALAFDCRVLWPRDFGGGCCTEVVRPGENIQAAIDRLPDAGGCVCLKPGVHVIGAPVVIGRSRVTFHGETVGAVLRGQGTETLIRVGGGGGEVEDVTIADLRLEADEVTDRRDALLDLRMVRDAAVRGCWLGPAPDEQAPLNAVGVSVTDGERVALENNSYSGVLGGVLGVRSTQLQVRDSDFSGPRVQIPDAGLVSAGLFGVRLEGACAGVAVERNEFGDYLNAVWMDPDGRDAVVARNRVNRTGAAGAKKHVFAIEVAAPGALVTDNDLDLDSLMHGGIRLWGEEGRIEGNRVRSSIPAAGVLETEDPNLPFGILISPGFRGSIDRCRVAGNRLTGVQRAITVDPYTWAEGIAIVDNYVEGSETVLDEIEAAVTKANTEDGLLKAPVEVWRAATRFYAVRGVHLILPVIAHNQLSAVPTGVWLEWGGGARVTENSIDRASLGVSLDSGHGHAVSANSLTRQTAAGVAALGGSALTVAGNHMVDAAAGVFVSDTPGTRVTGNRISGGGYGIFLSRVVGAEISGNAVSNLRRTGITSLSLLGLVCTDNLVVACGFAGVTLDPSGHKRPPTALGIEIANGLGSTTVSGCEVFSSGVSGDNRTKLAGTATELLAVGVDAPLVHGNRMIGRLPPQARPEDVALSLSVPLRENVPMLAQVADNVMSGAGRRLAEVTAAGDITFSGNRCDHAFRGEPTAPVLAGGAVVLTASRALSVVGNQVHVAVSRIPALELDGAHLSATGNVTGTDWLIVPSARVIPKEVTKFNIIGGL